MRRDTKYQTWKKRIPSKHLLETLHLDSIATFFDKRQARWAGHIAHMPWDRLPRKLLTSWCNSKQPQGGPHTTYSRSFHKVFKQNRINKDS
eukprot:1481894-Ditylum_brightwellii.AAC.1